jgi:hypothetical protein
VSEGGGPRLPWEGGKGEVVIDRLAGELMAVRASLPSAPGSRPTITLPSGQVMRMKVHRCRAITDDLAFGLEGRLIDGSRAVRAEIEGLLPPAAEPEGGA